MKNRIKPGLIMIALCVYFLILFSSVLSAHENDSKKVLVLHSYHLGLSWDDSIDKGIESVLKESDLNIETQIEHMDTKRIHTPLYLQQLKDIYQTKFRNRKFDLIISTDNNAFNFLLKHRDELFPQTPVVFCGVNNFQDSMLEGKQLFTGTVEAVDMRRTIDTALKMHPKTKEIVIYGSDTPTYFANKEHLNNLIPHYKGRIKFRFVEFLNIREVEDDIVKVPGNSLIFIISSIRDEQGVPMAFQRFPKRMASVSRVPMYSCWDFLLGHGIVGGKLISGFAQGETAAKIALRILHGEKAEDISVLKESPNRFMFDYDQMKRFGLDSSDLPQESMIINKPHSFYSRYKGVVWAVTIIISLLLLFIGALGFNIVSRKRVEVALRESEERYRTLVEESFDGIFIQKGSKIIFANQRLHKMLGYKEGELLGLDHWLIYHPEYQGLTRERAEARMRGEKVISQYEVKLQRKDGSWFYGELSALVINLQGRSGVQVWVKDIMERRLAREAVVQSEKRFRELFNSITDLIYTQDLEGRFLSANPALSRLFGYDHEEFMGRKASDFMKPELRPLFESEYLEQLKTEGKNEGITIYFTKDGHRIFIEYRSTLVRPEEGEPYISGTGRDVTERVLAERQIKKLQEQMLQAKKMEAIGVLAGGIAHDFNNLLMGIQGNASLMLLDTNPGHPFHAKLRNIEDYVNQGADLTKQLLGFARGGKYEVTPTDLNGLITHQNQLFGRTKKEIRISGKYEEDLWTVEVDQGQMEQVLLNLYINAWQAMPGGGNLDVQTENVEIDEAYAKPLDLIAGRYVKISISDNGVGMDDATRQRIFDPFFTTKEMGRGTGLGLASTYGIIKNHGGMIAVYSAKGEGTTFDIYLPVSKAKVTEHKGVREEELKISPGQETVLLVDDEEMIIDVGIETLRKIGYKVMVARSGREAIDVYEKNRGDIDMVILDMIMPDMGGGEAYDLIKEINPDVKVLLSSGYSINGEAHEILERGCNSFIQKPFNIEELSQKLREVLDS